MTRDLYPHSIAIPSFDTYHHVVTDYMLYWATTVMLSFETCTLLSRDEL